MIENEIKRVLNQVGVGIHLNGYKYIVDMVKEMFVNENTKITDLYKIVSEKYNVNWSRIERNVRHAILFCRENANRYFGVNYKMKNSSFIKLVYEEVKRNMEG